ncbi:hypothetical protein [Nocardia sp. NPDC046763]|uniref:hypothetical protein n=1 Tax=Nocardia sp. NPDC046763 TaxID=3155256 RepID=UPI0033D1A999
MDNHVSQAAQAGYPQQQPGYPPPGYPEPQYQQPQYQQPAYPAAQAAYPQGYAAPQSGGMLHRFLGSSFGSAMAMGAGFGLGDDLINDIFR